MRVGRVIAAAAISTVIAAVAGPIGAASAATGQNYVAMGDSYASGVGSGSYTASSGSCDRSTNAASALWAATHAPASYTSVACSGATTASVLSTQVSALSPATTLVSLVVGGNDENFSSIMIDCNLYGTTTCVNEVNAAAADAKTNLPGKLATLYGAIRTAAPSATVVVQDYPQFYDTGVSWCLGLSGTSRTAIDNGINTLDGLIQTAAAQAGFVFGDVRPTFTGHEICDGSSWLHSVDFGNITDSYHPTSAGQSGGYLPVLNTKL